MAVINGTNLNDIITTTQSTVRLLNKPVLTTTFADIIYGLRGHDLINGGGGSDILYGGFLNYDQIRDSSNPIVADRHQLLDDGSDTLYGEDGMDTIYGGTGNDFLYGGNDSDFLYGGPERTYDSDPFKDFILKNGVTDNDYLDGGASFDYLNGGQGNDTLIGGWGNDILVGGSGTNRLTGGMDTFDWFVYERQHPSSLDTITDFIHGSDKIVLNAAEFGLTKVGGTDPNVLEQNEVNPGHPLAARVFPQTQFYRLDSSEFLLLDDPSALTSPTSVTERIVTVYDKNNLTTPPAVYYKDGSNYQQLAVFTNGNIPNISGAINDFLIY